MNAGRQTGRHYVNVVLVSAAEEERTVVCLCLPDTQLPRPVKGDSFKVFPSSITRTIHNCERPTSTAFFVWTCVCVCVSD